MSVSNNSPQTPPAPTTVRVTFQSNPNSGINSIRSSNEGPASPNLKFLKEEVFENNLMELFTILTYVSCGVDKQGCCSQRGEGLHPPRKLTKMQGRESLSPFIPERSARSFGMCLR